MKKLIVILVLMVSGCLNAQIPDYYVYVVKGNVFAIRSQSPKVKLKQKDFVYTTDRIQLEKQAEIKLVNKQGQYLLMDTEGTFSLGKLSDQLKETPPGLTKTYMTLVWKELFDPHHSSGTANVGGAVGGIVVRGAGCVRNLLPYNRSQIADEIVQFKWAASSGAHQKYIISIKNKDSELVHQVLFDTVFKWTPPASVKKDSLFWTVRTETECEQDFYSFHLTDKKTRLQLIDSIASQYSKSVVSQLLLVDALLKTGLIDEAMARLDKLARRHPKDASLQLSYRQIKEMY